MHAAVGSIALDLHLTLINEWMCSPYDQLAPNRQQVQILAMVKMCVQPDRLPILSSAHPLRHVACALCAAGGRKLFVGPTENAAANKSTLKGAPRFCSCCARQRQKLKPEITIDS